jgi:uncharacterized membrane protein YcjF (UPF0283 family)
MFVERDVTSMAPADGLGEDDVRTVVREELLRTTRSLLGTVVWTLLSLFAVLVGLQSVQLALSASSTAATVGFLVGGTVVLGASSYLLDLLYRGSGAAHE